MDRTPRRVGAGAPPSALRWVQCTVFTGGHRVFVSREPRAKDPRSIAISLAIAIAVTHTSVCGFAIRGSYTTLDSVSDLTEAGSSLFEDRYDMRRKYTKAIEGETNNSELDTTVVAINRTEQNIYANSDTNFTLLKSNLKDYSLKPILNVSREYKTSNFGSKEYLYDIQDSANKSTVHETSPNVTVIPIYVNKSTENETEITKREYKQNDVTINKNIDPNTVTDLTIDIPKYNNESQYITDSELTTVPTQISIFTKLTVTTPEVSTVDYSELTEISTVDIDGSTIPYSTVNDSNALTSVTTESESSMNEHDNITNTSLTMLDNMKTEYDATFPDVTETSTYITNPPWSKITATENTLNVSEKETMMKAETAQTSIITLENSVQITSIPSLEILREGLLVANDVYRTSGYQDGTNGTESYLSNTHSLEPLKSSQIISTEVPVINIGMVSSKRGGYLDNTETSSLPPIEATTTKLEPDKTKYTEHFATMYETESYGDIPEPKNISGIESKSQLVEDAIKEELLREKTLNDNEENAKHLGNLKNKHKSQTNEVATNDVLSVKPITGEKKINTSLYAVNPNYKPLKKIDVQAPKQFVRDPDDNSWRNESIISLGIVFKPKNSSISFKQVLKNKTETELNHTLDKDNKSEVPDLRIRLEKIAEVRKSKKKKTNKLGEVVYTDYDSGEISSPPTNMSTTLIDSMLTLTTPKTDEVPTKKYNLSVDSIKNGSKIDIFNTKHPVLLTTTKPRNYFNIAEYYDTTDEYDADYMKVTKIDLQKFTKPNKLKEKPTTPVPGTLFTTPFSHLQDRRPTVQYFPPTKKVTQKVSVDDYDTDFQKKLNLYVNKDIPETVIPVSYGTLSPSLPKVETNKVTALPKYKSVYIPKNIDKTLYLSQQVQITGSHNGYGISDGSLNKGSYVIKHYKDFINEAVKDSDEDTNMGYVPFTESPVRGLTIGELVKLTEKDVKTPGEEYEYDAQFRKDIINRFVDNFNQNSERFKVEFPVLYNNSVVHRKIFDKELASSSAFLKRKYESATTKAGRYLPAARPCEPNCDKVTLDLSPDYEVHYYVPEQEEKEVMDHKLITLPYAYRNTHL